MAETGGLWILDGEDAGSTPWEWTAITNAGSATFALDAAAKQNGDYGYTFDTNGTDLANGRKAITPIDEIYVRFYIFIPTGFTIGTGPGNYMNVAWFNAGDEVKFGFAGAEGGVPTKWVARVGYDQTYPTTNFSLNEWHCIEIRYLKHASAGGAEFWVDGDSAASDLDQAQNVQATNFYLGASYISDVIGAGDNIYFDDIKADTSPVGAYSAAGGLSIPIVERYYRGLRETA